MSRFLDELSGVAAVAAELQHIAQGDTIEAAARSWRVVEVDVARHLLLSSGASSWVFVIEPIDDGLGTRLIVRSRIPSEGFAWKHIVDPASFVFERRMLLGLRERAERN